MYLFDSRRTEHGFTLIELLLAISLVAIISAVLYQSWFMLQKGAESGRAAIESTRETAATLDLLRNDLASAFLPSNDNRFMFILENRDLFGKPASRLLVTTIGAPPVAAGISDQMLVEYRIVNKGEKLQLRRGSRDIYRPDEKLPLYPITDTVEGLLIECWDGSNWQRSWDSRLQKRLPEKTRLTLTLRYNGEAVPFTALIMPKIINP